MTDKRSKSKREELDTAERWKALWALGAVGCFVASIAVQLSAPNHNLDLVEHIYRPLQVIAGFCAFAVVVLMVTGKRKD